MEPVRMGRWISILYRQFQCFINHELKEIDISSSEYIFLLNLYHHEGVSQEWLSSILFVDKAATARAISMLEGKGYVKRSKDEEDRRINRIYLTEKGHSVKEKLESALNRWNEIITEGMDPETVVFLNQQLGEMSSKVTQKNWMEKSNE